MVFGLRFLFFLVAAFYGLSLLALRKPALEVKSAAEVVAPVG
jgi:hypothetical protein